MKISPILAAAALTAFPAIASAALNYSAGYAGTILHTHANADAIVSYDWGSDGNLYYMAGTSAYAFGGLYRKDGGSSTNLVPGSGSLFSGVSVVALNSSIYYNDSDFSNNQFIRTYQIGSGALTTATTVNFSLGTDGSGLYSAGSADWTTTSITLHAGDLSSVQVLGGVAGSSGPLAFDTAGNLFYAPGLGDLSIYRWSAAEVASALSGGPLLAAAGHVWADYRAAFPTVGGGTAMAVDASGNLFITLTDFSNPSSLVRFDADGGAFEVIATSTDRLGDLRIHEGGLYLSDGSSIYSIVPEPSALILALFSLAPIAGIRRR